MDTEKKAEVKSFVSSRIIILSINKSDSKGEKAIWRHAFAKSVCEDIKAWALLERDIPEELTGKTGTPSYMENGIYMAIAAYAACGSNVDNVSLGQAAAALGESSRDRFTRLEKARSLNELWMHLKSILRLISSKKGTGLDYGLLAKDLVDWQFDSIRTIRKWERDYYHKNTK